MATNSANSVAYGVTNTATNNLRYNLQSKVPKGF